MSLKSITTEFLLAAPEAGQRFDGGYSTISGPEYILREAVEQFRFDAEQGDLPSWTDAVLVQAAACATEDDLANLRVRLLELGGLCAAWVADIDLRMEDAA